MEDLFTLSNFFTLLMLIALQAVLGFDNLLYISIESRRVDPSKQKQLRQLGIGLAIIFRLMLLLIVMQAIQSLTTPFFTIALHGIVEGAFNFHAIITLLGGGFIMYTAIKEIFHLMAVDHLGHEESEAPKKSFLGALFLIVSMNLVFSFDSLLSAIALTHVYPVMATAIIIGGALMIWASDHVANFLEQNRVYEVLGLFVLLIVGVLLLSEGGHLAHLKVFSFEVTAMSKTTFYFVIFVMAGISIIQTKYRNKLLAARDAAKAQGAGTREPVMAAASIEGSENQGQDNP